MVLNIVVTDKMCGDTGNLMHLTSFQFTKTTTNSDLVTLLPIAMEIRTERSTDINAIRQVHIAAFNRSNEAILVDALRQNLDLFISLVAVQTDNLQNNYSDKIVGNICFTPVVIVPDCQLASPVLGLAPLAVLPEFQRQKIGTLLVQNGLKECTRLGFSGVVVLGDPEYYHRFGFVSAKQYGLSCEYDVPEELFMAMELQPQALEKCHGVVKYSPDFASV